MSFEEKLINLVKEHEYLYNTKSRTYKNTTKRASTWDTISKNLNRPVQECKQRWRSLRDRFSREHKDMMSLTSGSAAVIDPDEKWEFYDCLQFLIPSLITRRQIGNTENEESCEREVFNSPPPIVPQNDVGIAPKKSRAVKRKGANFQKFHGWFKHHRCCSSK